MSTCSSASGWLCALAGIAMLLATRRYVDRALDGAAVAAALVAALAPLD